MRFMRCNGATRWGIVPFSSETIPYML